MTLPHARGFTLIELMIAVAIVAILAGVALPAYQEHVRKSRRADAHVALATLQLAQERHRSNNPAYASALGSGAGQLNQPSTSADGYYTLGISGAGASGYTLTATAASGKSQAQDSGCTAITLTVNGNATTHGPTDKCWNK